jgi:hypothetical protein
MAYANITFGGSNGDLPDEVDFNATDAQILSWVTEALQSGGVPGIAADPNADLSGFVVDRFAATGDKPERLMVRPKTPFGC